MSATNSKTYAAYLNSRSSWSKWFRSSKSWASWPLKMASWRLIKEAENAKSQKVASTKPQTNCEKSRSWWPLEQFIEIYDYLTGQASWKTYLKKFLWLTPFLLFALYWLGIYLSLRTPWKKLTTLKMVGWCYVFKPFTETIGNDGIWKKMRVSNLPLFKGIVDGNEDLSVMMFRELPTGPMYDFKLEKGLDTQFIFKYSSKAVFSEESTFLKKILPARPATSWAACHLQHRSYLVENTK